MDELDLFIIQHILTNGWIDNTKLKECMLLYNNQKGKRFLYEIFLEKGYLSNEQLNSLYKLWLVKSKSEENKLEEKKKVEKKEIKKKVFNEEELRLKLSQRKKVIPKKIGPYIVEKEIGKGGMGVVYLVKHPELEYHLALKILHKYDLEEEKEDNIIRFHREIEMASKLRHPNIIGIHDVGSHNGVPYYVMDYIDGETLDKILDKKKRLEERKALEIIEKVANGVAYAHKNNIIHRDIKPANIIIEKKTYKPYLMDFGIAKCKEDMFKKLTKSGTIMGTPEYMPPEQARGLVKFISFPSDVYSLGATLYHMVTGRPPFTGESPFDIITKVVDENPVPPTELNSNISKRTEAVILKALSKNISERYPNAKYFELDIRALLRGGELIAKPESKIGLFLKKIKNNIFIIFTYILLIIGIVFTIYFLIHLLK